MATRGFAKTSARPRTANSGGGSSIIQRVRIFGLADADKRDVELTACLDFAFGGLARADFRNDTATAAARQCRQGFERRARLAAK
jgi:hypothetical protein